MLIKPKIIFVRSGNNGVDPISTRQAESLMDSYNIFFYNIIGKGFSGYIKNIFAIRKFVNRINPDIIHCHYSLSGFLVFFAFTGRPIITSLMGSDVLSAKKMRLIITRIFINSFWKRTIAKSDGILKKLNNNKVIVIPNGINLDKFYPLESKMAKEKLGWDLSKKHVLFCSDPSRKENNFPLAQKSLAIINPKEYDVEVHYLFNIDNDLVVYYYSAADVLLLTSFHEGSPNVIKEAMACNCPIVATKVGDVELLLKSLEGCYVCETFDHLEVANNLVNAFVFNKRTEGRNRIKQLEIGSDSIASKIGSVYKKVLKIKEDKILVVCSGNKNNFELKTNQVFIYEQVEAIKHRDPGIVIDYFIIKGKGFLGYLKNIKNINRVCYINNYKTIHAHFAFSGLLANCQRKIPVVTTFHGSDINIFKSRLISFIVELLDYKNIYVSNNLFSRSLYQNKKKSKFIPCGIDFSIFYPIEKTTAREVLNLDQTKYYILFSSSFNNNIKNYALLKEAVSLLKKWDITVIELKGYNRNEVSLLMNAVDICILTSFSEGSPQFIKEAIACNCPVISTDVGDVKEILTGVENSFIINYDVDLLAEKIKHVLLLNKRTQVSKIIKKYDNNLIAGQILDVYAEI